MRQKTGTYNRWLEKRCDSLKSKDQYLYKGATAQGLSEPLLPASAIESLLGVAVSKTPPIDVTELAVEPRPRLCPYRPPEPGVCGVSLWGKAYWDVDNGLVIGDS